MTFKTVADIKRAMQVGTRWHCLHHGSTYCAPKDMGVRTCSISKSTLFAMLNPETKKDSYCDFPLRSEVTFDVNRPAFTILNHDCTAPLLTYTLQEA